MDKSTKNGVLVNSESVEQSVTFTPEEACGELEMFYDIDTTNLAGAELVIFESLYIGDDLILEHKDFNNESEFISVEVPAPDTGVSTRNHDSNTTNGTFIFIGTTVVICFSGYASSRLFARRKFYK
jgi:hypothetical protein